MPPKAPKPPNPNPTSSDSEEDADYVYEAPSDDEGGSSAANLALANAPLAGISEERRSAIDDMFEEMSGAAAGGSGGGGEKGKAAAGKKRKKPSKKAARKEKKSKSILADIFGDKNLAKKLVKSRPLSLEGSGKKRELKALERVVVTETKKFAGKEITVKKTVTVDRNVAEKPAEGGGLDGVLADLKGPEKISTIAKTATDWDGFKESKGLNDELAKATEDGYLVRKDFMSRVDERQFENERKGREKDRMKK